MSFFTIITSAHKNNSINGDDNGGIPNTQLIAQYRFDGNDLGLDSSGNSHQLTGDGLLHWGDPAPSDDGTYSIHSCEFDSALLYTDTTTSLSLDQDKSFFMWVKPTPDNGSSVLIQKGKQDSKDYTLSYADIGFVFFDTYTNSGDLESLFASVPTDGSWFLLSAWVDFDTQTKHLQVNDAQTVSSSYTSIRTDNTPFLLGGSLDSTSGDVIAGLVTLIDEVSIWNRILSPIERGWVFEKRQVIIG